MKSTAIWFCLLGVAGAGCIGLPKETKGNLPKAPQAEFVEPPVPVNPDQINENNVRQTLKQLDQEITFDERSGPLPEAPSAAENETAKEQKQQKQKQEKPKRSSRPWGPTWG